MTDPFTSRALARSGCYERFAARVMEARPARVLDLACGDGYLTARVPGAIGIDLDARHVADAGARGVPVVQGRAQQLPFADGAFDAVACHLAFMLFDELEAVVAEIGRVLVRGGRFHALLGGGPAADADDAFSHFAALLPPGAPPRGDRRANHDAGWRELFAAWPKDRPGSGPAFIDEVQIERWPIDLAGSLDEVWTFLGASYQLAAADHEPVRAKLRARFPTDPVPCTVVTFYARVTR